MEHTPGTCHNCKHCGCMHHKIVPALVGVIGLSFLLTALGVVSAATNALIWPAALVLIALTKLSVGKCACYKA